MKKIESILKWAVLLSLMFFAYMCGTISSDNVTTSTEVTRIVEVTRQVEVTRLVQSDTQPSSDFEVSSETIEPTSTLSTADDAAERFEAGLAEIVDLRLFDAGNIEFGVITIEFNVSENVSEGMTIGGAKLDTKAILEFVQDGGTFRIVNINAFYDDSSVARLGYDGQWVKDVNFITVLWEDVYTYATAASVDAGWE